MTLPDPLCPLCQRPIPAGVRQSQHHLIPKLKGGKGGPTILVHHICHQEIHATLTEAELARAFNTPKHCAPIRILPRSLRGWPNAHPSFMTMAEAACANSDPASAGGSAKIARLRPAMRLSTVHVWP